MISYFTVTATHGHSPIVKVIFHGNDFSQEAQRAQDEKRVRRFHKHKDSS